MFNCRFCELEVVSQGKFKYFKLQTQRNIFCNFQNDSEHLENSDVDDGNEFDLDIENINLDDPLGFVKKEKTVVKEEKQGKNVKFST